MKWKNNNFYPNKYRNFHDCNVTFVTVGPFSLSLGLNTRIVTEMSEVLQFNLIKVYALHELHFYLLMNNASSDFYDYITNLGDEKTLQIVTSSEALTFLIPNGKPLTTLKK